ncbi:MAG: DUF58 domain-containing protein [Clostridia bacterium]|nr:DUF58 domain-containing protein [Clostridia bacterium]
MPFSRLFALLVFLGVVPIYIASFFGWAVYVFIIYNALLAALLIVDFMITPGAKAFEVTRVCDEKFSLGIENHILIKVRNRSAYKVLFLVRDDIPPYLKLCRNFSIISARPFAESEGGYSIIPEKRGEFKFGNIYLKCSGVLKLCSKTLEYDQRRSYKVYPNLRDLRKYSIAAISKSHFLYGTKKAKGYGIGSEFESLREYNDGDDYRKINWMATARAGKFIVNNYEPEKNQQIFIMLDSSRVMNSEINYIKKLDYSINASFLLAEIATKKGDNTGLIVFDNEVRRFIKPGKGSSHFNLIAENLYNVEENLVTADYKGALMYLNKNQMRRSLLCIFTELFNVEEASLLVSSLKSVAKNHVPLIITIKDMRLYEIMKDDIKNTNDVFVKAAAMKLIQERERIQKLFFDSGIACLDVPPDKLSIELVNKYLNMKSMMQI